MTEFIIIAAVSENNVIGRNGKIPWHIKDDFRHFRELTANHPCIMGRNTYESLPVKPLPERENIVITRNKGFHPAGASIVHSFEDAIALCKGKDRAFIIGGESIYRLGMNVASVLEITRIHRDFEGDTFFPDIDQSKWVLLSKTDKSDQKYGEYSFLRYIKR